MAHCSWQNGKLHPGHLKRLATLSRLVKHLRQHGRHPCFGPTMVAFSPKIISPGFRFLVATKQLLHNTSLKILKNLGTCNAFLIPSEFLVGNNLVWFAGRLVGGPFFVLVFHFKVKHFFASTTNLRRFCSKQIASDWRFFETHADLSQVR